MNTQHSSKKGFTLIELLVVIAIIAILAAILFPVFARARENARRTSCMSNLKQIGLGMMQYVQDYDGIYPARYYYVGQEPGVASGTMIGIIVPPLYTATYAQAEWTLEPYIKSRQLAVCPSWTGNNITQGSGYAYNLIAGAPYAYTNPVSYTLSESQIQVPAEMVAFADSSWYRDLYPVATVSGGANGVFRVNFCTLINNSAGCNTTDPAINRYGRHMDGVNASYMDGHAKWNRISHFVNGGKNYPVWQGW